MIHYRRWIPGLILLLFATSCTLENKLADNFLKKLPEIDIQLFTPDMVYKYNHKGEEIRGFDKLSGPQQDSALNAHSRYIQFVNDPLFLDTYVDRKSTRL